ncbi:hypothetical protein [Streptomyces microflavus]|uniref:hypothetical protein n=1 Tax=Streptomyces microflavus TaxID=1919 RepID=UPI0033C726CD
MADPWPRRPCRRQDLSAASCVPSTRGSSIRLRVSPSAGVRTSGSCPWSAVPAGTARGDRYPAAFMSGLGVGD